MQHIVVSGRCFLLPKLRVLPKLPLPPKLRAKKVKAI
jgi:hypothetical protein